MIKMIQFILLLIMQLGTLSSFSQKKNIADYFREIPENYLNIASSERDLILKSSDAESAIAYNVYYRLDTIDYRNGFLSIHSIGDGAGKNHVIMIFAGTNTDELSLIRQKQTS